jgi:hypothetical protein
MPLAPPETISPIFLQLAHPRPPQLPNSHELDTARSDLLISAPHPCALNSAQPGHAMCLCPKQCCDHLSTRCQAQPRPERFALHSTVFLLTVLAVPCPACSCTLSSSLTCAGCALSSLQLHPKQLAAQYSSWSSGRTHRHPTVLP